MGLAVTDEMARRDEALVEAVVVKGVEIGRNDDVGQLVDRLDGVDKGVVGQFLIEVAFHRVGDRQSLTALQIFEKAGDHPAEGDLQAAGHQCQQGQIAGAAAVVQPRCFQHLVGGDRLLQQAQKGFAGNPPTAQRRSQGEKRGQNPQAGFADQGLQAVGGEDRAGFRVFGQKRADGAIQ